VRRGPAAGQPGGRSGDSGRGRGGAAPPAQQPPAAGKTGTLLGVVLTSDASVVGKAHLCRRAGAGRMATGSCWTAGLSGRQHEPQAIAPLIAAYVNPTALYGCELLTAQVRHGLDMVWEGALGVAMGREVGSGPRRLPPSYCRWLLGATPLATPTSALARAAQLGLWAKVIAGEFGTLLSQKVMMDSWHKAWARFIPPGPSGVPPTRTDAKRLQAATVGEDVLRAFLKTKELRHLVCEEPWRREDLVAEVAAAVEEERERLQLAAAQQWERAFGPAELYSGRGVSRKGWARLYALQASPALLLATGRGGADGEVQCCAGCGEAAPQAQGGAWVRTHALLHCVEGEGMQEARRGVLAAAAARAQGWAALGEEAQAMALLGAVVALVGGGRGRLQPEHSAELLGKLAGAAW